MFLDWLENLPDRWKAKPLRSLASYAVSNVNKSVLRDEIPVRLCNYTDVYHNEFIDLSLDFMRATASEYEIEKFGLSVGDIVITKDSETWDDIGVPALVRETDDDLVCGYHLAILRPDGKIIDGAFLFRCLQAKSVRLQLELSAKGVTRFGLPKSEIGAMTLPVPPLSRQRAIADYLDRETARLDMLVAAKERLLELLAEKRRALITSAVTGGVEYAAALAEGNRRRSQRGGSGYRAPVGGGDPASRRDIVEHDWRDVRFRYLADVRKGAIPVSGIEADLDSESLPYLTMEYLRGDGGELNLVSVDSSLLVAPDESILLLWDGANAGEFFRAKRGIVSSTSALVMPKGVDRSFLYWVCKNLEDRIRSQTIGMGVPHVNGDFLANMVILLPSPLRQRAIADYLDRETARIDELAARTRDTIALLRERRAALVAAAVTGQIDMERAS